MKPFGAMTLVEEAILFATRAHTGQKRKATDIPYIWHPLRVASVLVEVGSPEPVVIAGVLHDTLEDTGTAPEEIERVFGRAVLDIVKGASEPDKSASWEDRKRHTIEYLRTAPPEVKLVAAADKLDNIRAIAADLAKQGEGMWSRFKRGRADQAWYYRGLVASLGPDFPDFGRSIVERLTDCVEVVFGPAN
jgi:(p)ppGpp synthase/HD superfamily hydrolase